MIVIYVCIGGNYSSLVEANAIYGFYLLLRNHMTAYQNNTIYIIDTIDYCFYIGTYNIMLLSPTDK